MGQVNELKNFSRGQIDATSKNEHGHYVFTITGLDLTGKKEIARMEKGNFRLSDYARQTLTSINADSYNANHRLEDGKEYNIVLVPGREVKKNRMTANIQKYARSFGYEVPFAGVIPRIREAVSDKQMEQMNIWYIACLHMPIKDTDGDPLVLGVYRHGDGRWLYTYWGNPDYQWYGYGAFAFLVLAS